MDQENERKFKEHAAEVERILGDLHDERITAAGVQALAAVALVHAQMATAYAQRSTAEAAHATAEATQARTDHLYEYGS